MPSLWQSIDFLGRHSRTYSLFPSITSMATRLYETLGISSNATTDESASSDLSNNIHLIQLCSSQGIQETGLADTSRSTGA